MIFPLDKDRPRPPSSSTLEGFKAIEFPTKESIGKKNAMLFRRTFMESFTPGEVAPKLKLTDPQQLLWKTLRTNVETVKNDWFTSTSKDMLTLITKTDEGQETIVYWDQNLQCPSLVKIRHSFQHPPIEDIVFLVTPGLPTKEYLEAILENRVRVEMNDGQTICLAPLKSPKPTDELIFVGEIPNPIHPDRRLDIYGFRPYSKQDIQHATDPPQARQRTIIPFPISLEQKK